MRRLKKMSYEGIPSYLVAEHVTCLMCVQVSLSFTRRTENQKRALHVTDRVQMSLTLDMFARQRFGSVRGSEALLASASPENSFPCSPTCAGALCKLGDQGDAIYRPAAQMSTSIRSNVARILSLSVTAT